MKHIVKKYLPVTASVILLSILAAYAPWSQVWYILDGFKVSSVVALVLLSALYYALKSVRYWYLLRAIGIRQPFKPVVTSYMSAQPVSLLPAGEIYRSHALERYTGVSVSTSLPQFTLQGLLEGAALCSVAFVSAIALQTLRVPFLLFGIVVAAVVIGIRKGHFATFVRLLNKLPFVNVAEKTIEDLSQKHAVVFTRRKLPLLYAISIITELVGAATAYTAVAGLGGHISIFQATLFYVIPLLIGFISLLPGGFGASEHSAVAVLLLSEVSIGQAVAATLVMRVAITGLGVVYGLLIALYGRKQLHT